MGKKRGVAVDMPFRPRTDAAHPPGSLPAYCAHACAGQAIRHRCQCARPAHFPGHACTWVVGQHGGMVRMLAPVNAKRTRITPHDALLAHTSLATCSAHHNPSSCFNHSEIHFAPKDRLPILQCGNGAVHWIDSPRYTKTPSSRQNGQCVDGAVAKALVLGHGCPFRMQIRANSSKTAPTPCEVWRGRQPEAHIQGGAYPRSKCSTLVIAQPQ